DRRRRVEFVQLEPTVAVRGPHHRNLASNVLEPNDTVHPTPLDGHLAIQLHTKFHEECLRRLEVLDHDEDVVHSSKRHVPPPTLDGQCPHLPLARNSHAAKLDTGCCFSSGEAAGSLVMLSRISRTNGPPRAESDGSCSVLHMRQ